MSKKRKKKLIIAGGGTGGHIHAGVAISQEWARKFGERSEIQFIGAKGRLEEKLVPRYNYPLHLLNIGPLNRVSVFRKLTTLVQIPLSFLRSFWILIRFAPDAVIGVGGYSSGPVLMAAKFISLFKKIRIAVLEQNAVLGLTNRVLAKISHRLFSNFPLRDYSVHPDSYQVVGNPIRMEMKPLPSANTNPFCVFIFGGSQGSMGLNTLIIEALPFLKGQVELVHQTGELDFERVKKAYEENGVSARIEKFIYDMPQTYESSSIVIGRAGASTLTELAAIKRASILVPLPTAADDHQTLNAKVFENAGATKVLSQSDGSGERLAHLILELKDSPSKLHEMEQNVAQFYHPNAAKEIVDEVSLLSTQYEVY